MAAVEGESEIEMSGTEKKITPTRNIWTAGHVEDW